MHQTTKPFSSWAGPKDAKLVVLGECFGGAEADTLRPFVGEAGKEFWLMLGEAMPDLAPELHREITDLHRYGPAWSKRRESWLQEARIGLTTVFNFKPPSGKLDNLCTSKAEAGKDYPVPAVVHGKYLRKEYLGELARCQEEISQVRPNLVLACGATACWAMLGTTGMSGLRGTTTASASGQKVLPTYHPASVLFQWNNRPILVTDLMKARREMEFLEVRRPARRVLINPELSDIRRWVENTLLTPPQVLSVDIETGARQIKCIGFGRSREEALVVPFVDLAKPGGNYWPNLPAELEAWRLCELILGSSIPKLFQNGMYDLQYISALGLVTKNCWHDSMLLHHSIFPEMPKALGFLGSIYTSEPAWKLMRTQRADTEKKDE